jgi:hypothetical protein
VKNTKDGHCFFAYPLYKTKTKAKGKSKTDGGEDKEQGRLLSFEEIHGRELVSKHGLWGWSRCQ